MNTTVINQKIQPYKDQLLQHPLYNDIKNIEDLHCFLENHVFAVWDFMSLLKALQNKLTCTTTPWIPVGNPEIRYLINEIVLAEETDIDQEGHRKSHYELYLDAMEACGADTNYVTTFLTDVEATKNIFVSIKQSELHPKVKAFLDFTFRVVEEGQPHQIAAAFTFGREDLIPDMFTSILKEFQNNFPNNDLSKLIYYFERHIELDADEHGPMAMKMIEELCGNEDKKWQEVEDISIVALEKRIELWDAIQEQITHKKELSY
jgi:pyrroloquinoline quinone (PQQ) biosynthesis protein C